MSVMEDLRSMAASHRRTFGREPLTVRIGRAVAEKLAVELAEEANSSKPWATPATFMQQLMGGGLTMYGMTIEFGDRYPTPEQADAIEGYRQVGPC